MLVILPLLIDGSPRCRWPTEGTTRLTRSGTYAASTGQGGAPVVADHVRAFDAEHVEHGQHVGQARAIAYSRTPRACRSRSREVGRDDAEPGRDERRRLATPDLRRVGNPCRSRTGLHPSSSTASSMPSRRSAARAAAYGSGTRARTTVPPPAGLSTSSVPPIASSRSASPRSPEPPAATAPPLPSSAISAVA